ncbi:MAG: hypothetical protein PVF65_10920 [Sphingomonadales bacterium]|jgi:hypothetical protein
MSGEVPQIYWQAFQNLKGEEAGLRLDIWLGLVAQMSNRPLKTLCPAHQSHSEDERHLLAAIKAYQSGDAAAAKMVASELVPYSAQSALFEWAGQECAASLMLCDIHLSRYVASAQPSGRLESQF